MPACRFIRDKVTRSHIVRGACRAGGARRDMAEYAKRDCHYHCEGG
jgi:hypothetical protein